MAKILLVEDSDDDAALVRRALRDTKGSSIERARTVKDAKAMLGDRAFDLAILDYKLPDGDGLDVLGTARVKAPGMPVLFLTGHGSESVAMDALRHGASDYMCKEADMSLELPVRVEAALARRADLGEVAESLHLVPAPPGGPRGPGPGRAPKASRPLAGRKDLQPLLKSLGKSPAEGVAIYDRVGRLVAAQLPKSVAAEALGAFLVGMMFQAQGAIQIIPEHGRGMSMLLATGSNLVGVAALPSPGILVLLFPSGMDPTKAMARVQEAAREASSKLA